MGRRKVGVNMISIYDLKPKFQNLLRPCITLFLRFGITPNQVTVTTMLLSVGVGILLYFNIHEPKIFLIMPIFLFLRMALNAIDGMMAKEHDMKSPLGKLLNEIGDVVSDVALYFPFMYLVEVSIVVKNNKNCPS